MKNFNPKPSEFPAIIEAIQAETGYRFKEPQRLVTALTHSSYTAENLHDPGLECNERLEFLGDAVLELIVSQALYSAYPGKPEGWLTASRALLVNEEATSGYALRLGLERALLLGRGAQLNGDRHRKSLLGDAFEAVLGAVYLDGGISAATALIQQLIPDVDGALQRLSAADNPKGQLQDYCQRRGSHRPPEYIVLTHEGPVHAPHFTVELHIDGRPVACGSGSSKRNAEQAAAAAALKLISSDSSDQPEE